MAKGAPVAPQLVLNPDAGAPAAGTASGSTAPAAQPSATATGEAPASASGQPITAAEAASLSDMMRAVVTSGHAGFLSSVPGAPVGAKTGTAEFGNETPPKTHAWIVAVHGDLAVAVFVEDGGLGATTSGPAPEGVPHGRRVGSAGVGRWSAWPILTFPVSITSSPTAPNC